MLGRLNRLEAQLSFSDNDVDCQTMQGDEEIIVEDNGPNVQPEVPMELDDDAVLANKEEDATLADKEDDAALANKEEDAVLADKEDDAAPGDENATAQLDEQVIDLGVKIKAEMVTEFVPAAVNVETSAAKTKMPMPGLSKKGKGKQRTSTMKPLMKDFTSAAILGATFDADLHEMAKSLVSFLCTIFRFD